MSTILFDVLLLLAPALPHADVPVREIRLLGTFWERRERAGTERGRALGLPIFKGSNRTGANESCLLPIILDQ